MKDIKVLIIGGTRFFGKEIAYTLENKGYNIYTASNKISNNKKHFIIDRKDKKDLIKLSNFNFDIVIDQICYNPIEAKLICEAFRNKAKHIIFTSSFDIYTLTDFKKEIYSENDIKTLEYSEIDFNPKWENIIFNKENYVMGKYHSEAVFINDIYFKDKVSIIRLSNAVSLLSDPTNRFSKLYENVKSNQEVKNSSHRSSFIHFREIADIYENIIKDKIYGIYNVASVNNISLHDIYKYISAKNKGKFNNKVINNNEYIIHPTSCVICTEKINNLMSIPSNFWKNIDIEIKQDLL